MEQYLFYVHCTFVYVYCIGEPRLYMKLICSADRARRTCRYGDRNEIDELFSQQ